MCVAQVLSCQTGNLSTVNSLCKDTQYEDKLDVRTMPVVTNHCILTAVVPLSNLTIRCKDNFLGNQSSCYKKNYCTLNCSSLDMQFGMQCMQMLQCLFVLLSRVCLPSQSTYQQVSQSSKLIPLRNLKESLLQMGLFACTLAQVASQSSTVCNDRPPCKQNIRVWHDTAWV